MKKIIDWINNIDIAYICAFAVFCAGVGVGLLIAMILG